MAARGGPKPDPFSGDLNQENPEQFWRDAEEYLIAEADNVKCVRFKNLLRARSPADLWYKTLGEDVRTSWSSLQDAFAKEFISTTLVSLSDDAILGNITQSLPKWEDLITYKDTQGGTVPYHIWWKNELRNLVFANRAGDHLANTVVNKLPHALRSQFADDVRDWATLYRALDGINVRKLQADVEYHYEISGGRDRATPTSTVANIAAVAPPATQNPTQVVVTVDVLTELLNRATLAHNPVSQFQTSQPSMPARVETRPLAKTNAQAVTGALRYLTPKDAAERFAMVERNALAPPPNTDEGRAQYERQVRDWHAKYEGQQPNEQRPYPLTPGTLPVAKRDCWKCGQSAHGQGNPCNNTKVPELENTWRVIAGLLAKKSSVAVNQIGDDGNVAEFPPEADYVNYTLLNGQLVQHITTPGAQWAAGKV
ncbi:hypothetical protein C8Q79DRAFT_1004773 [Trametes meyenii]|nr:hypothetical protein C8Q79DRAFT_1004773 [Trametes meyenii]